MGVIKHLGKICHRVLINCPIGPSPLLLVAKRSGHHGCIQILLKPNKKIPDLRNAVDRRVVLALIS